MSAVNYTYTVLIFNFTIKTIRSRLLSLYQAHSVPLHTSKQPVTREQENVEGIFSEKSGLVFFSCGNNKTITGSESKRGLFATGFGSDDWTDVGNTAFVVSLVWEQ